MVNLESQAFLVCSKCGNEILLLNYPETVICPVCGEKYERVGPIEDVTQWLSENWMYVALGFGGLVALYAILR